MMIDSKTTIEEDEQTERDLWQLVLWAIANSPLAMAFLNGQITVEEGLRLESGQQIGQWGMMSKKLVQA